MPINNYVKFIKEFLFNNVALSFEITDALVKKFGIRKEYARTVLNRINANDEIYHTGQLYFKSGQRGYSLDSNPKSFLPLLKEKPRLMNTLTFLERRRVISKMELLKISGALNLVKSNYYDLTKLVSDVSFFYPEFHDFEYDGATFYAVSRHITRNNILEESDYEAMLNKRLMDLRLLPLAISFSKTINIIGNKARYVETTNPFSWIETRSQLAFDAVSYTKIGNINSKSTICVFDISISEYYPFQFEGFKYRYRTLINSTLKFQQRVIPILIVNSIPFELEKRIKEDNEIIILKLSNVFGSRITKFLEIMEANQLGNLSDVSELIRVINNTNNAKQLVRFIPFAFELVVNAAFNHIFSSNLTPMSLKQTKIKFDRKSKEFDGFFEDDDNLYFIESKLYKSKIVWLKEKNGKTSNDCLKYFFVDKYEFIKQWCIKEGKSKKIRMCFISASGFHDFESGMKTIDSKIESFDGIPFLVSLKDLIDVAKIKNVSVKELDDWVKMYYSPDDVLEVEDVQVENGIGEMIFTPPDL